MAGRVPVARAVLAVVEGAVLRLAPVEARLRIGLRQHRAVQVALGQASDLAVRAAIALTRVARGARSIGLEPVAELAFTCERCV